MNEEFDGNDNTSIPVQAGNLLRPLKRVLRPLNPEEKAIRAENGPIEMDEPTIVFRLKRNAELGPLDTLAIGDRNVPKLSKKVQAKNMQDLEADLNMLNFYESEDLEKRKEEDVKRFLEGLGAFNENQNPDSLVLKRIDPSNIFELEQNEELFRKTYKTIYNDKHTKERRDKLLDERRKNLLEKDQEKKDAEKDKKYEVYDIHLKEEFKQGVLYCNDKPMKVTNLLEIASHKEDVNEGNDEDDEYHYYLLKKAPYREAAQAKHVMLHPTLKGVLSSHLAPEEMGLVPDDVGEDSEEEMNKIEDNADSNDENNPRNEYPDEEEEGLGSGSEKKEESDFAGYDEDDDDEDDGDNYDEEEEGDMEMEDDRKTYYENKFKNNFWSKIKDMSQDDFEWPTGK